MKKRISIILTCILLIFAFCACDTQSGLVGEVIGSQGTGTSPETEQETTPETAFSEIGITTPTHEIPEVPEGVVQDSSWGIALYVATEEVKDLDCSEVQSVQNAYFAYLESVSAHLGKTVNRIETTGKTAIKNAALALASGSDENMICMIPLAYAGDVYTSGDFYNVYDLPHINPGRSYWNADFQEEMQVDGALYALCGALTPDTAANVQCYAFNPSKAQEMGLDLYATVDAGDWTFDALNTVAKAYEDVNKNGYADQDDTFGVVYNANFRASHLFYGSGMKAYADGSVNPDFSDQACSDALAKLTDWFTDAPELFDAFAAFENGNATMYATTLADAAGALFTDAQGNKTGIVPCPKYAKEVKSYASPVSVSAAMVAVGESTNAELAGYCLELMAVMADMSLTPVMQDCLYNKLPDNEQCREMIDLLCKSAAFDRDDAFMYFQNENPIGQAVMQHTTEVNFAARKNNTQKQLDMIYSRIESANKDR
ncbi:MAG: hypothetical protein IJW70_10510 [Clostridia bacterium]|nr:hypothetical protein [Clostridia bacterium]